MWGFLHNNLVHLYKCSGSDTHCTHLAHQTLPEEWVWLEEVASAKVTNLPSSHFGNWTMMSWRNCKKYFYLSKEECQRAQNNDHLGWDLCLRGWTVLNKGSWSWNRWAMLWWSRIACFVVMVSRNCEPVYIRALLKQMLWDVHCCVFGDSQNSRHKSF